MPINKLIEKYKNNLEDFKNISRSKEDNNKSCVNSEEVAINGDNFKDNCPPKTHEHKKKKSVDAISYNKDLMFIEFKIKDKKGLNNKLKKILKDKFAGTQECFQHQIDEYCEYPINKIKNIFVCKIRNSTRESSALSKFKKELERDKKTKEIFVMSSHYFDDNIQYYKFDISN